MTGLPEDFNGSFTMLLYIRWLLVVVCLLVASSAEAITFYVATTGLDTNSCTAAQTLGTPKRNIAGPAGGLACLTANPLGNRLEIRAGTYSEKINSGSQAVPSGTSWANAPVISNYNGETVTLNPGVYAIIDVPYAQYLIFNGFILDGLGVSDVALSSGSGGGHHIRFQNIEVKNTVGGGVWGGQTAGYVGGSSEYINLHVHNTGLAQKGHGIYIASSNNIIEGCVVHDNYKYGIHVYDSPGVAVNNNIVRRNRVYNHTNAAASVAGIIISSGNGNIAHNNILYNNVYGITVSNQAIGNKVYNNTIYNNTVGINTGGNTSGVIIKNNILYLNSTAISDLGSGTVQSNNPTTNPSFLDAINSNFALLSTSGAINTGTAISGFNFNGSAPDVGAHETIVFASAKILNDADDKRMEITFTNNVFPPLLPATGCTGFTARKNTVNNPIILPCVRSATGVITLTLTNSYINTDTADFSYTTATGNVTDSALIGGTNNQRLNALTNQSADTSTLAGGGTVPFLEQIEYQFESPGGPESLPDYKAPLNVGIPLPPDKCTVIRSQIVNTVANINSAGYAPFAQRTSAGVAGGWAAIANGPCSSTGICFITGTGFTMPERIAGPTTDLIPRAGTFVPGGVQTSNAETPTVALTTAAPRTQLVAAVCNGAGNVAGDYFDVRWYRAGIPLDSYAQTPRITIGAYTRRFGNQ